MIPPFDRDQTRANALIEYLRNAEHRYFQRERTIIITFRSERARLLTAFFVLYLVACTLAYALPSPVGENIARLRFAALPIAVLALSLRASRPRVLSIVCLALALS